MYAYLSVVLAVLYKPPECCKHHTNDFKAKAIASLPL